MLIVELAIPFTRLVRAKNMVDSTAFSNLSGGQFTPESSGQFDPKWGGQFRPEQVVSLNRIEVVSFTEFSSYGHRDTCLIDKGSILANICRTVDSYSMFLVSYGPLATRLCLSNRNKSVAFRCLGIICILDSPDNGKFPDCQGSVDGPSQRDKE